MSYSVFLLAKEDSLSIVNKLNSDMAWDNILTNCFKNNLDSFITLNLYEDHPCFSKWPLAKTLVEYTHLGTNGVGYGHDGPRNRSAMPDKLATFLEYYDKLRTILGEVKWLGGNYRLLHKEPYALRKL